MAINNINVSGNVGKDCELRVTQNGKNIASFSIAVTQGYGEHEKTSWLTFDGFCRYLTTRELELAQTLPVGYTKLLSIRQAEKAIGNGWTVDVIAHILKYMNNTII